MRLSARAIVAAAAALSVGLAVLDGATGASAVTGPAWAPAATARVHPGVQVTIAGVKCVAGFIMTDGRRVFVAVPGSCAGVDDGQPTNGCTAAQVPYGLNVTVQGARYPGRMVYSSYTEMQLRGTTGPNKCANNALVLIQLNARDIKRTNPSVPVAGGPTGVATTAPSQGETLTAYVSGMPAQAMALQTSAAGWAHSVEPSAPIPAAQLGAPVLNKRGQAIGMVTLVAQLQGGPVTVSDLYREIAFMHTVRGFGTVQLARGTTHFRSA